MSCGPATARLRLMAAVVALLAIVGMHALDTTAHLCHVGSAAHGDGEAHHDGHADPDGRGHASCAVAVGCVAIVLAATAVGAGCRRRDRSAWPNLVAAVTSFTRGPEPPVPRALLSI